MVVPTLVIVAPWDARPGHRDLRPPGDRLDLARQVPDRRVSQVLRAGDV
jgi:hypothetical protein